MNYLYRLYFTYKETPEEFLGVYDVFKYVIDDMPVAWQDMLGEFEWPPDAEDVVRFADGPIEFTIRRELIGEMEWHRNLGR